MIVVYRSRLAKMIIESNFSLSTKVLTVKIRLSHLSGLLGKLY